MRIAWFPAWVSVLIGAIGGFTIPNLATEWGGGIGWPLAVLCGVVLMLCLMAAWVLALAATGRRI